MLNTLLEKILSLILPKGEEIQGIEDMSEEEIALKIPLAGELDGKYKAIFQYKNNFARKAIWEIKYRANKKITGKFSKLLYEFIIESISDDMAFSNFNSPLIIPVPGSRNSFKIKGFNQSELIVREIAKLDTGKIFDFSFDSLRKIKETENQSKVKNRERRLKNLIGCFEADTQKVYGRSVIVIDDVITTGATMREISKTLRDAGAKKVIGFALAH